ncbi:uncharacterized protein [Dermacentor albipictus]|uniref:uncharacterized protein isoform X2 n=1 Tax=Dermacentor albipictus TaxID=60249 RepID=UPI0031FC6471
MDPPLLHPLPTRRRASQPRTNSASGDNDARHSGPSAAAAASPHGDKVPRWATELNCEVGRWSGTAATRRSAPEPCSVIRTAHNHPCSGGFRYHGHALRETEKHRQQSRRDLPQDARVRKMEHAKKGTSPISLCDDHGPNVTYTFQSTPQKKERPNDLRRSGARISDLSRFNAGSSTKTTAAVRSSVNELRSAHPVSTVLRNLAAALFPGRWNALDRTPRNADAARAFDDTRTLSTEQEQARTYSCTVLLCGKNEEITFKNKTTPCSNDQRESVDQVCALESKSEVEATQCNLRDLEVVSPPVKQLAVTRDAPECSGHTEEWEPRCSAEAFAYAEHLKAVTVGAPEFPALTLTSATSAVSFAPWCHSVKFGEPLQSAPPNVAASGGKLTPDKYFDTAVPGLQKSSNLISLVTYSAQADSSTDSPTQKVANTNTQTSEARITCTRTAQTQNADTRWTEICAPPLDQNTNPSPSLATSTSLSDVVRSTPARSSFRQMPAHFLPLDLLSLRSLGHISAQSATDIVPKETSKNVLQEVTLPDSTSAREPHILTKSVSLSSRRCTLNSGFKKNSPNCENPIGLGSEMKTSSCPTFKKRTWEKPRVAPCGSKPVLFPWGQLDAHENTGMCLLHSTVLGRLFRKEKGLSTPIIPAMTVSVSGTANKGRKAEFAEKPTTTTSNKDILQEPQMHLPSFVVTKDLLETTEATEQKQPRRMDTTKNSADIATMIISEGNVGRKSEKPKDLPAATSIGDTLREEEVRQRGAVVGDSDETKAPNQLLITGEVGVRSTMRPPRFGMSSQRFIATSLSHRSQLTKGNSQTTEGELPGRNLDMQPLPIVHVIALANTGRADSHQTHQELTVKGGRSELPEVGEALKISTDSAKDDKSSGKLRSDDSFVVQVFPHKFVSCSFDWVDEACASNPPVRSFSENVVKKRDIVGQEAMIKRVHHCKNPKHNPRKKFRPGNYCLTCKNPRHRHGLPEATTMVLQPEIEKYIFSRRDTHVHRHKKENDSNLSGKLLEPEEKEIAKNETRVPVTSVKREQTKPVVEPPVCCCLSMAACATIVALALVYLYFVHFQAPLEPGTTLLPPANAYYCSTEFCNREAERLKSVLSSTTGPCDDFYQHVCDKWVRSQRLESPGTGTAVSSDTIIQDRLIDSLAADLVSSKQATVALELYNSCTDRTQSGRAFAAMDDLFRQWTIGRWPLDALASARDVWYFAGELLKDVGLNALVDVHVAVDSEDPTKVAIGLKKPSFLFSCNDAARPGVINMLQDALVETMAAVARSANQQLVDEVMQVITRLSASPLEPPVSETGMRGFNVVRLSDMDPGVVDLLRATFGNDSSLGKETKVVLKSADFLQGHLVAALRELPPRAVMNYLGFLVFINLAPFFLDRHRLLRQLFSKSVLGRTLPDVSNTGQLCLVAVERVLPGCFAKVSSQYFQASGGIVANKLSQLVTSFGRSVEYLAWMDDMAVVLSRYLLKEFATTPSSNDSAFCPSSFTSYAGDSSVKFFVAVSRERQRRMLRLLTKSDSGDMAPVWRSQLLTTATYDAPRRRLHIPAALFNVSVPANTSHFSLHFARFAVRFYRAVVEALLFRDAVQPSLRYSDDLLRRFEDLLGCFEWELRQLPAGLSHSAVAPHSVTARGAFLQQTVAVQLAFRAFQELLQIRRTWNMDFRFAQLPELSVDQLFFVYYALDNCEAADKVYQEHRGHWLPAHYRVNVPLRNVVEFAELFRCPADADMVRVSFVPRCAVVAVDRWDHGRPV